MKKVLVCTLLLIISTSIFAVNHTGDFLIGGKISYSEYNYKNEFIDNGFETYSSRETGKLFLITNFGYFVSKSCVLGLGLQYNCSFSDYSSGSPSTSTAESYKGIFSFVPFVTKYFKLNNNFSFNTTLQLEVGFGKDVFENEDKTETELFKLGSSISPAISYSLSQNWLISLSFGSIYYDWTREMLAGNDDYKNIDQRFGINLSLDKVYLGIQYIF